MKPDALVKDVTVPSINIAMRANLRPAVRWFGPIESVTPSVADTPFTVPHSLGSTPTRVDFLGWADLNVWSTADDRNLWDGRFVVLRSDTTDTKVDVWVGTMDG